MRQFSDLLGSLIKDRGFTIYGFAKQCGIERTLLQKYISGARFPSDYQVMSNIMEKLRLSPSEEQELQLAYEKAYLGDNYEKFRVIETLINELSEPTESREKQEEIRNAAGNTPENESAVIANANFTDAAAEPAETVLDKRRDIQDAVIKIIGRKIQDPDAHIRIVSQTENNEIEQILHAALPMIQCNVHQLVCMDPRQENVTWNIELIKRILPLFLSSMKYDVKYYYSNAREHVNSMSIMPNLVLTDDCAISFDFQLKHAVIYHDKNILQMYYNIYKELEQKSKNLIKTRNNSKEEVAFYLEEGVSEYGLDYTPCVTYSLTLERLKNLIIVEDPNDIQVFSQSAQLIVDWYEKCMTEGKQTLTYYLSKDGFDYFMQTGRIFDYSFALYHPAPRELRLAMMEEHVQQIETGVVDGYLLKEDALQNGPGMWLACNSRKSVSFVSTDTNGNQTRMQIYEDGIINVVYDYLDYLKESPKVYSKAETVQWIRERTEYWREKYSRE